MSLDTEIIDYVMHTPNNSNPNVMRGILGKSGGSGGNDIAVFDVTLSKTP